VVLAQHARLNVLDKGALLMQLCNEWLYGAQTEVEGIASHKFKFLPSNFCAPVKVAPIARVMPVIPRYATMTIGRGVKGSLGLPFHFEI